MKTSSTPTSSRTPCRTHTNSPRLNRPLPSSPVTQAKTRSYGALTGTPIHSPPESPSRYQSQQKQSPDLQLALSRVIGTTAKSPASLDSVPSGNTIAFTAGAAAVLVTVGSEPHYKLRQRFFRARPTTIPLNSISGANALSSFSVKDGRGSYTSFGPAAAGMSSPFSSGHASEWADSPGGKNKSWSSKERIKAANAVSLSSDGKFLAVGETGYKPRVLIFSTSEASPMTDTPLTALAEHTFGVRAVAFSPNSRFLASLGATNDGFLYIWAINGKNGMATLHASNKCTNPIQQVAWIGNTRFVTIGVRHVKIWRIDESDTSPSNNDSASTPTSSAPKSRMSDVNGLHGSNSPIHQSKHHHRHKTLCGRNCLLGSLLEATFTSITAITDDSAIVCTMNGDICLLDDSDNSQRFHKILNVEHGITASTLDSVKDLFHIADTKGEFKTFATSELLDTRKNASPMDSSITRIPPQASSPVSEYTQTEFSNTPKADCHSVRYNALSSIKGSVVAINDHRSIQLLNVSTELSTPSTSDTSILQQIRAHKDSVLGVRSLDIENHLQVAFYTWSADGSVLFWSSHGSCTANIEVELEQPTANRCNALMNGGASFDECGVNELRAVNVTAEQDHLLSGDKLGILRVINVRSKFCEYEFRAHSAEITDIAIYCGSDMLLAASAGRDRTVQVFCQYKNGNGSGSVCPWQILQTLEEHVGAVTGVMFSTDGKRLVSRSSDRTVVIREYITSTAITDETTDDCKQSSVKPISGFLLMRTIMLKASPVAMTFQYEQGTNAKSESEYLWISTIDRHLHRYNVQSGQLMCSFKTADSETGDAVILSSLLHMEVPSASNSSNLSTILAGVSSTDKSVRLYDESGKLICRDWGHTEGVSAIALVKSTIKRDEEDTSETDLKESNIIEKGANTASQSQNLVTVAVDGTIFVWELESTNWYTQSRGIRAKSVDHPDANTITPTGRVSIDMPCSKMPPLRRVLSQSELARLQRSPARNDTRNTPARVENENMLEDEAEESGNSITTTNTTVSVHSSATSTSSSKSLTSTPTRQRARSPGLRKKGSRLSIAPTPRLEPIANRTPRKGRANATSECELDHAFDDSKHSKKGANRRRASVTAATAARRSPSPTSLVNTQPQSPSSPKGRRLTQNHPKHGQIQQNKGRRMSVHAWSSGSDKVKPSDAISCDNALPDYYCHTLSTQAEELCSNLRAYRDKLVSWRLQAENDQETKNSKETTGSFTLPLAEKVQSELELTLQAINDGQSQKAPSITHDASAGPTGDVTVALGSSRTSSDACEADMEKLLDRYSERLVGMLDMRIAAGVAKSGVFNATTTSNSRGLDNLSSETMVSNDGNHTRVLENSQPGMHHDMKAFVGTVSTAAPAGAV